MTAKCLHCSKGCRLTNGKEVYPHRKDLWRKPIYVCDPCGARVGCHPGTRNPLGFAANAETRNARMILHNSMLDKLWKNQAKGMRSKVYAFLADGMGLTEDQTHTGMFTIEQCREAWRVLKPMTPESIREWAKANPDALARR